MPIGAALCYAVWRLFEKRKARNPDGPYWGNSPIWGALGTTLLALFAGFLVRLGMPRLRDNTLHASVPYVMTKVDCDAIANDRLNCLCLALFIAVDELRADAQTVLGQASVALSTVPLPPKLRGEAVACFLLAVMMGAAAIFLR